MIFLLAIVALGWVFIQVCGTWIGWKLFKNHRRLEKSYQETPDLMSRGEPVGEKDLEGWNGATVLEIDEDW